ncbi:hypothetical protein [Streptomyces sp. NPDC014733]|uniref:hypothetical protein n=1 Tax=Streptomyces sp. NPDC014733 TaxID=3364885 RepID=UPI00370006A5
MTSATRLLDVLPLLRDLRIQLLATCTGSSPFQAGVPELLAEVGVPVLPWAQALRTRVDLAVSASFGGQLHEICGKLAVLSHGVGYNKTLATPDAGRRTPDAGRRTPDAGRRTPDPVFGMSDAWLLVDGEPVADAMVLSHPEQLTRLREACPAAAHTAVVAGDPCFDRLLDARPYRERFRRALGLRAGQRLVVLNSTWNPASLFGDGGDDLLPSLLPRLTGELPADDYRLAAVLHPNIWHGHGPGQVRAWLERARRGGLALLDPLTEWRQALLAADLVIGDHGSVTYYAAALGTPVLLGAAPLDGLDPASPVADFVRTAPRLDPLRPLRPQLESALSDHRPHPGPAELTTSVPGKSAALLRALFHRLIGIPEPGFPAHLDPLPLPDHTPPRHTTSLRVLTRLLGPYEVALHRYAEPSYEPEEPDGPGSRPAGACGGAPLQAHLAAHEETADREAVAAADVIFRDGAADDPRLGPPAAWCAEVLARHPQCALAVYVSAPDTCTVRLRTGATFTLTADASAADPAALASALFACLSAGTAPQRLIANGLTVRTTRARHRVTVAAADDGAGTAG